MFKVGQFHIGKACVQLCIRNARRYSQKVLERH